MKKTNLVAAFTVLALGAAVMQGQSQVTRTWVSSFGSDSNPCSRTAPCKTFAGALTQILSGGEIDVLDPGSYGSVTITQSVTIDGGGNQVASAMVSNGNGIVVQPGATDVVFLRNLRLDGLLGNGSNGGNAGVNGIRWLSGKALHIENCEIFGFNNNGIDIAKSDAGRLFIANTVVKNNGSSGVRATNTANVMSATIVNSQFEGNGFVGVYSSDFSTFSVSNSDASGNAWGYVAQAFASGSTATMNIQNSMAANNGTAGMQAGGSGPTSTIRISNVGLFDNGTSIVIGGGGTANVVSWGNNYNSGTGAPSSKLTQQ